VDSKSSSQQQRTIAGNIFLRECIELRGFECSPGILTGAEKGNGSKHRLLRVVCTRNRVIRSVHSNALQLAAKAADGLFLPVGMGVDRCGSQTPTVESQSVSTPTFADQGDLEVLLACLADGSSPAWEEVIRRLQPLIAGTLIRTARQWDEPSPATIDDLVQDTFLKLFAQRQSILRNVEMRHDKTFFAYLKVMAANVAHDHYKAANARKRGSGVAVQPLEESAEPGYDMSGNTEQRLLISRVETALSRLLQGRTAGRDKIVFWLHYRDGMSASAIAAVPALDLTAKGVESLLHRIVTALRRELTNKTGTLLQKASIQNSSKQSASIQNASGMAGESQAETWKRP